MRYTIGEAANILGVSASTLRYYDQEGLLPLVERSSGGVRIFTAKDLEWLRVIECLKKSGLSIREIRAFTDMVGQGDASLSDRLALFRARREAVLRQMEENQRTLALLDFKCWYYTQAAQDGTEERVRAMPAEQIPEPYRTIKEQLNAAPPDTRQT